LRQGARHFLQRVLAIKYNSSDCYLQSVSSEIAVKFVGSVREIQRSVNDTLVLISIIETKTHKVK